MEPSLIEAEPNSDIFFKTLPGKNSVNILKLKNIAKTIVAYKIKTTSPKSYVVKPNQGMIQPGQVLQIEFTLHYKDMNIVNGNLADKFMIQAFEIFDGYEPSKFSDYITDLAKKSKVQAIRIRANLLRDNLSNSVNYGLGAGLNAFDRGNASNNGVGLQNELANHGKIESRMATAYEESLHGSSNRPSVSNQQNPMDNNGLFYSALPSSNNIKSSFTSTSTNKESLDKLWARVEEQEKQILKLSQERNQFFVELTNLKESNARMHNKGSEPGFQLWQILLVSVISIIIGAFLCAP